MSILVLLLALGAVDLGGVHLPTPEGWREETIPFPLSFAPDLPHRGVELLRFAPGFLEQGQDGFWSYVAKLKKLSARRKKPSATRRLHDRRSAWASSERSAWVKRW